MCKKRLLCMVKMEPEQHRTEHLGPISQRDLSPDLDLNLRLWS